jgi:glucosamine 6-phosphate synthetase-like amidotransferase/phosphosugar isomerase protein
MKSSSGFAQGKRCAQVGTDQRTARGTLAADDEARLALALIELPSALNEALALEEQDRHIAEDILAASPCRPSIRWWRRSSTVPVQLIAYYTAVAKGTDVDQPRNLAKSVTVE